jgi:hypothetical protein
MEDQAKSTETFSSLYGSCRRLQKKYENPQSQPVAAAQLCHGQGIG